MNDTTDWIKSPVATPDNNAGQDAEFRQTRLTKPEGSLGRLEDIAITLASLQRSSKPAVDKVHITVFAADHGVAANGVSAFPQNVTSEMIKNFAHGGAAICVLAREIGAELKVINLGTVHDSGIPDGVENIRLGPGTANFVYKPAMNENQLAKALHVGRHTAERSRKSGMELFIGGDMGIGNTTSATALASALLDLPPERLVGPGTGLDIDGIKHKCDVIQHALDLHKDSFDSPFEILRRLGGFEISALVGAYLACAKMGIPVLIDGFISTVSALVAESICPGTSQWFLYSHASAEPGHTLILDALNAKPLVDFGMRLGEGSGAATLVPILRLACRLHNDMATFEEAQISGKL